MKRRYYVTLLLTITRTLTLTQAPTPTPAPILTPGLTLTPGALRPGEIVVMLGQNGMGKSLFIKVVK